MRLSTRRGDNGFILWIELQAYPACLLFYALGLGSIEAGERGLMFLGEMFRTPIHRERQKESVAVEQLPAFCLFQDGSRPAKLLEGMEDRRAPFNDWLHDLLHPRFQKIIPSDARFSYAFDKLEILMALSFAHHAIETYHRRLSTEKLMNDSEFSELCRIVIENCPEDHKEWLKKD